ncbi:beta-N-acetylhexosaminidase [Cohnella xylanilytica]|uniref:Beta-N-acetylhexosaminidase n=1 Tax=Cohnella xylanilytica TaxID=557555 RepID=A0A841U5K8_9BACL|nr:beta-N-acetylhexosaminidase [Cohnella xylanilytica]MBB6693300.1 beta-N-acetylhexosaminidase [Cohnella xylanilytica]
MKVRFEGDVEELLPGIRSLAGEIGIVPGDEGTVVKVERSSQAFELEVGWDGAEGRIRYGAKHQFFRGLGLFVQHRGQGGAFSLREKQQFDTVGPMFDLSRNAVLSLDGFKSMLNKLALMGMNAVMLYMEDTYAIEEEPYFGYMRGRYSQEELREIDDYADRYGIEAFPSIQTLAHLEEFLKWEPVRHYRDTKGALLVGEEATDRLVENMIDGASWPFRSRKIHIGMDEAEELGRGKYLDRNGYKDRFDMMAGHLDKVLAAVRRRGLRPMMWSDMFLKLAAGNAGTERDYYDKNTKIPEEMASRIPKDATLVYWDYVHLEPEEYENVIANHRPLGGKLAFAGAVWIFNTFGVNYGLSLKASDVALQVCKKEGIREAYATMWGDDGNEGNPFAALLGLQLYAEHAYSEDSPKWERLAERVKFCTGIPAETFLRLKDLDEVPGSEPDNRKQSNPSKFLLYQDVLLGLFDKQIEGLELAAHYEKLEREIAASRNSEAELDYLFEVPQKLCAVLKLKSEIGIELKRAYDRGDREALRLAAAETLPAIASAVRELRLAHRTQWMRMFKPFGWEVIDIRYGGVLSRLDSAAARLLDYAEGRIPRIEELEQERLVFSSANRFNGRGVGWCSHYYRMASPNVFFHVLNPF